MLRRPGKLRGERSIGTIKDILNKLVMDYGGEVDNDVDDGGSGCECGECVGIHSGGCDTQVLVVTTTLTTTIASTVLTMTTPMTVVVPVATPMTTSVTTRIQQR